MTATTIGVPTYPRQRSVETRGLSDPIGVWPRTTRILPWMLAAFLMVLWLVPFQDTTLPVTLPVESTLDRFVVLALGFMWIIAALGAQEVGPKHIRSPIHIAVVVLMCLITLSVLLNLTVLARLDELDVAIKKLALIFSFGVVFYITATTVKRAEIRAFTTLIIILACITAVGTIVEYRTGVNHFYDLAASLIPGISVGPELADKAFGRPSITGPTGHGLAVTTILMMSLPFAMVRLLETRERRDRLLFGLATALILAGSLATQRKTAAVLPAVGLLVLLLYRPRSMVKLLPLGFVVVLVIQGVAPSAISGIRYQLFGGGPEEAGSTRARQDDYPVVAVDIAARPFIGRGFGAYDPTLYLHSASPQRHRVLDNSFLGLLVDIGILGTGMLFALCIAVVVTLHRDARSSDPARAGPALAIISATAVFVASLFLFDAIGFAHVPYFMFFLIGLAIVVRTRRQDASTDARTRIAGFSDTALPRS